jgi:hypothetical protein
MGTFVFNIAKGRVAELAALSGSNDAFLAILLKSSGLETDSTLQDYDTLAAILAGTNDEADFSGYSRATLTGVTVTVDDTNNRVDIDCDDPSWSPSAAQALGKLLICYDADTTTGTDANIVPLIGDDFVVTTPTTGQVTYQVASGGFFRAS